MNTPDMDTPEGAFDFFIPRLVARYPMDDEMRIIEKAWAEMRSRSGEPAIKLPPPPEGPFSCVELASEMELRALYRRSAINAFPPRE